MSFLDYVDPISPLNKNKSKGSNLWEYRSPAPYVETDEMRQAKLDNALKEYEGIHKNQLDSTRKEMFGDSDTGYRGEGMLNAVAGARERGAKDVSLSEINALRVSLGLPPVEAL